MRGWIWNKKRERSKLSYFVISRTVSLIMTAWSLNDAVDLICRTMRSTGAVDDAEFCLVRFAYRYRWSEWTGKKRKSKKVIVHNNQWVRHCPSNAMINKRICKRLMYIQHVRELNKVSMRNNSLFSRIRLLFELLIILEHNALITV